MLPLEDTYIDILRKAMRGGGYTEETLAAASGLDAVHLRELRAGTLRDEQSLRRLCPVLNLDAAALLDISRQHWTPLPRQGFCDSFAMYTTPYKDFFVNAYLLWDPATRKAAAFDTGTDCDGMLADIAKHGLELESLFLTHSHTDHIMEIDRLMHKTGCRRALIGAREPVEGVEASVREGDRFSVGGLRIRALDTFGHTVGGVTYVVEGLKADGTLVALVGDSLFSGSMGGGLVSHQDALRNNLEKIMTLPDTTILCSGHGPLTSVAEEKRHNPFFAGKFPV
ncbi:MAG: MBL fold metallo-hydrolase [Verrucomicrobiae bacterium]|nr:MBL fold metallo-hydrolase [Verrucomicrobiae bacterium]